MQIAKSILERSLCVMSESPNHRAGIPRRCSLSCHPTPRSGHGDARDRDRNRDRNRLVQVVAAFARRLTAFPRIACLAALTLGALAPMPVAAQTMDVTTVPGVPTDLEATVSTKTRIRLSWTAPANTGGTDTAIAGYRIEYSAPDYLFPQDTNVWAELEADTGSASTTYDHDHELAPGVRLEYRISAINDVGIGDPSDVVEAATQAAPDTAGNGAPDSTAITVNGRRIVIAFDEVLDAGVVPNRSQFQIRINRDAVVRPERVEVTGATVVLALEAGDAVDADDSVGVRYTWPRVVIADAEVPWADVALQDVEGNLVERWNRRSAVNETTDSGLTLEPATIDVEEGGSDTYTVVLKSQPAAEVTIDIRAGGDVTATPASLTFGTSDWDTTRTVTVSAAQDGDGDDDSVTLVHDMKSSDPNYDATDAASVTVTVEDRYAVVVTLSETTLEIDEGSSATYTVVLDAEPLEDVVVAIYVDPYFNPAKPRFTVEPENPSASPPDFPLSGDGTFDTLRFITFTPSTWDTPHTVTVHAPAVDEGGEEETTVVRHDIASGDGTVRTIATLTVTAIDSGAEAGTPEVVVSTTELTVVEGGRAAYVLGVSGDPSGTVVVIIESSDPGVRVSPATVRFDSGNWEVEHDVTVSTADGASAATISHVIDGDRTTGDVQPAIDSVAVTVGSKPSLSAADAEATEGEATMDFAVALDAPAATRVTVDYATADGSATAGEDYVGKAGTLTFAAGETRKTVLVSLLVDAKDEGDETFTLKFSNPSGVRIEDGEATGTIANDESVQEEWLARLGRTVAAQVVDAVSVRLEGNAGSHVTMGGRRLGTSQSTASPETVLEHWADRVDNARDRDRGSMRPMSGRELLSASSFHLASEGEAGGSSFAAWGRVAGGGFEADVSGIRMDGEVTTGIVGADVARNHWLAGAAVSFSTGEGGYRLTSDVESAFDRGTIESTLTSVYPYARLRLSEGVSVWGLAGYGTGELALTERSEANTNRYTTDTTMRIGALGVRKTLVPAGETGGLELAAKSDVFWMRMTSDAVEGIREAEADASRLRFVLDASRSFDTGDGATLTPNLELGLRHDGGDAETGTGAEVGVGIGYAGAGVSIEGSVRALVAHEASGYEEWGASGSVRVEPDAAGRGLSLTVAPSWGNASSAQERLWSAGDAGGLISGRSFEPESRLAAELGYGLAAPRSSGLVTPFAGLSWGYGGRRIWRAGTRWEIAPRASLSLEASRSQPSGDGDTGPVNAVALRAQMRW